MKDSLILAIKHLEEAIGKLALCEVECSKMNDNKGSYLGYAVKNQKDRLIAIRFKVMKELRD